MKDLREAKKELVKSLVKNKKGFKEAAKNQKFFFLGPKNNWKEILEKNICEEIEIKFYKEMKELNYL